MASGTGLPARGAAAWWRLTMALVLVATLLLAGLVGPSHGPAAAGRPYLRGQR